MVLTYAGAPQCHDHCSERQWPEATPLQSVSRAMSVDIESVGLLLSTYGHEKRFGE